MKAAKISGKALYRPILEVLQEPQPAELPREQWHNIPESARELCSQDLPAESKSVRHAQSMLQQQLVTCRSCSCACLPFVNMYKYDHGNRSTNSCATCYNLGQNQRKRGQAAAFPAVSLKCRPGAERVAVMEPAVTTMVACSGAQAITRSPLTLSALPMPGPDSITAVQGRPSAGDGSSSDIDAESDGYAQHSASKPSAVIDSSSWTAGNVHASSLPAIAADLDRPPAGQAGAQTESTDLYPWLKCLTVEQLLVCGLLSLRQQPASRHAVATALDHSQPAFDLSYLPQWQTAVDHFASKELAEAVSKAAQVPRPSAPDTPDAAMGPLSTNCKKQKLTHGGDQIPLLSAADEAACRCFAATIQHAMAAVRRSGGQMYTSSNKIYRILHRCSECPAFVAVGMNGAYSSPAGDGGSSKDSIEYTNRDKIANTHFNIRCWSCLD